MSSPILRDVRFRYEDDEILSRSLTSTNFHTYYQGSEMVVAGRLPPASPGGGGAAGGSEAPNKMLEYEIHATQARGHEYSVTGTYNGSAVSNIVNMRYRNETSSTIVESGRYQYHLPFFLRKNSNVSF